MRCHIVSTEDSEGIKHHAFAGTTALAKDKRNEYMDALGVKRSEVTMEVVDIPLAKNELLEYLNGLLQGTIHPVTKETKNEKPAKSAKPAGPAAKADKGTTAKAGAGKTSKKK